jgi:hypothetical protein
MALNSTPLLGCATRQAKLSIYGQPPSDSIVKSIGQERHLLEMSFGWKEGGGCVS